MTDRSGRPSIKRTPRPRDRKEQIVAASADLFYRHGYHNVSTGQIAEEVGVTAGALYRHFASKQDLLAEALISAFDHATTVVRDDAPTDLEDMVHGLAETASARRDLGVLWNRESRHLDAEHVTLIRERFFGFVTQFAEQLQTIRPELSAANADLLAWCALGVMTSPSYHQTQMDPEVMIGLIQRMTLAVCTAPLDAGHGGETPAEVGLLPQSRREAILTASARLFDTYGYQSTSMDDIGAAVGITNAGVYTYFDSKSDLLSAIITRASEPLHLGLSRALASATTPAEGVANALDAYIDFALVHHDLVGILVSEVMNLPEKQRRDVRRDQHEYVTEWMRLLRGSRPEVDESHARFVVQAVLTTVSDATRTASLRRQPSLGHDLGLIGRRLLVVEV